MTTKTTSRAGTTHTSEAQIEATHLDDGELSMEDLEGIVGGTWGYTGTFNHVSTRFSAGPRRTGR